VPNAIAVCAWGGLSVRANILLYLSGLTFVFYVVNVVGEKLAQIGAGRWPLKLGDVGECVVVLLAVVLLVAEVMRRERAVRAQNAEGPAA
jgi:hypothetical protein